MPRMRINGELYEIPQSDVGKAQSEYGAVPADSSVAAPGATASNPLGAVLGGASSAVNAIGGPRVLVGAGAAGGVLGAGKYILDRMRSASANPPATATPAAPPVTPAAAAKQAASAIAEHPALASEPPTTLQQVRELLLKKPAKGAYSKVEGVFEKPVTTAKGRVVGAIKPKVSRGTSGETVPIEVQGKPDAVRGVKQRGVSGRALATRAKQVAAAGKAPASAATDLEFQLQQSVKFEREMAKRGIPAAQRIALRRDAQQLIRGAGLRGVAGKLPGALGMLMMINDARSMPEQLDEADQRNQEMVMPPELLEQMRRQPPSRGI